MSLKLRFALLFTFFVAIVLLVSSATIYILYFNYRQGDFYDRVRTEGLEFYDFITKVSGTKGANVEKMMQGVLYDNALWDENLAILDSAGNIIDKLPDTAQVNIQPKDLQKIKKLKEYGYTKGERQFVCMYLPDTKRYIIASGLDIAGLSKLENLKIILSTVFIGGLLLTALISFFFVKEALKPLRILSTQMQRTTELNLTDRLPERKTEDELKQITRNFNEMLDRLNKAFESQKSFVHHASHELRTPLASMLSQTEAALNKKLTDEGYKKVLSSLKEDQVDLIELTNSLLLLSQYEKLNPSQIWPKVRIDEVLYDTIGASKKMLPDAEIIFQFLEMPENENDIMVQGNEALLKVALGNLIKNAIQYSTDKKVVITVEPCHKEIYVHFDNMGKLLSVSEANNLVIPFFRGINSASVKGFGLGLSIVQRIIQLHNGALAYVPLSPDTNRFTITLKVTG